MNRLGEIFVVLFDVDLPDVSGLRFYRLMFARDEKHLRDKIKVLTKTFAKEYDEYWNLCLFWNISKVAFTDMHDFVLTDKLINWKE